MIFHINGFTLSLILKQRLGATRKWPIVLKAIFRLRSFPGSFLLVPTEQERPLRTRLSQDLDGVPWGNSIPHRASLKCNLRTAERGLCCVALAGTIWLIRLVTYALGIAH